MSALDLEARVYSIVAELFNVRIDNLMPESSPKTIESWDSTGHLDLVLALEQEFGVQFSPDQMDQMMNLNTIVEILAAMKPVGR